METPTPKFYIEKQGEYWTLQTHPDDYWGDECYSIHISLMDDENDEDEAVEIILKQMGVK